MADSAQADRSILSGRFCWPPVGKTRVDVDPAVPNFCSNRPSRALTSSSIILSPRPCRTFSCAAPLSPHLPLRSCGLRRSGAFGNAPSILSNLLALLYRLRYEQTMNKSIPIRHPHLSLRGMVPSTGRSAERTRANTFWPNEPKHIVSEPKPDTHFPQTNPISANEPNGESVMKTMFEDERCNLRK